MSIEIITEEYDSKRSIIAILEKEEKFYKISCFVGLLIFLVGMVV